MDANTVVLMVLRWIHFMAGVTWIGHLYFFNVVNVPLQGKLDGDTKRKVNPQLMPRALWWFRWGAMTTFLSGLLYIYWKLWIASDPVAGFTGTGGLFSSVWGGWTTLGGAFGTIMWFNVWFIIWPAQKKLIAWVRDGQAPPEMPGLARRALLTSRLNTYLSVPLLFAMGGASHYPSFGWLSAIIVVAVGLAVVWVFIKVSPRVGTSI